MNNNPLLTIGCITYNHAGYISQCIEGFLMQKTTFPFEIIIHDDASTDGTSEIVKEYADKYPDLIKAIIQTKNQYSNGGRIYSRFIHPISRGKYIATCEGDDYWTDPYKLQKQVDFLEANPKYVFCGHNIMNNIDGWITEHRNVDSWYKKGIYDIDTKTLLTYWPVSTLTMVERLDAVLEANRIITENGYKHACDLHLFYHLTKLGLGYALPDKMAVYRIHSGGVFGGANAEGKARFSNMITRELFEKNKDDDTLRNQLRRTVIDEMRTVNSYSVYKRIKYFEEYLSVSKGMKEHINGCVCFILSFMPRKLRFEAFTIILKNRKRND